MFDPWNWPESNTQPIADDAVYESDRCIGHVDQVKEFQLEMWRLKFQV